MLDYLLHITAATSNHVSNIGIQDMVYKQSFIKERRLPW